jgi:hypothetical protein
MPTRLARYESLSVHALGACLLADSRRPDLAVGLDFVFWSYEGAINKFPVNPEIYLTPFSGAP